MKDLIGKAKKNKSSLPQKVRVKKIATEFNRLFANPGYDEISFIVIKKYFSELCEPLKDVFNLSIKTGMFPDKLKIAPV